MQDAVVLANCLYDLRSLSPEGIREALQAYRDERFPHVKEQYEASKINAKLIYGQVRSTIRINLWGNFWHLFQ